MKENPHTPPEAKSGGNTGDSDREEPAVISQVSAGLSGSDAVMRMGLGLVISVMVCAAAGLFLDRWLGTTPLFMVLGLFLGAGMGFMVVLRTAKDLAGTQGETTSNGDGHT